MRQIVSLIIGIVMVLYMMYWMIPLLNSEHTNFANPLLINSTDPTVVTSFALGQGFYTALPLIPILAGVFLLINYALKRDAGE